MQHAQEFDRSVNTDRRVRTRRARALAALLVASLLAVLLGAVASDAEAEGSGAVVVANRGSGDISVIDTTTLEVSNIDLPGEAEPMYVNHDPARGYVFVGDRATDSVLVLDDVTYAVLDTIAVGEGVFHQWYDRGHLWVVGDIDNTVTVINTRRLEVVETISIPADVVARGGKPHDVTLRLGRAFVSIVGLDDGSGLVLRYSTDTYNETGRIVTGGDPHVFQTRTKLYVASQDGGTVERYRLGSLEMTDQIALPNAHGIYVTGVGRAIVTNIGSDGASAVTEFNTRLDFVRSTGDTEVGTAHNVGFDRPTNTVYITHSGPTANQVSVLRRDGLNNVATLEVGTNPFGLAAVNPR